MEPKVGHGEWRRVFRHILREITYLPDPIAKKYMRDYAIDRFRRYSSNGFVRWKLRNNPGRQVSLWKQATQLLSMLHRANAGYIKPLEKTLRISYGRLGRRRWQMLAPMIVPEVPRNTAEVRALLRVPATPRFSDSWKPPSVMVELLKSQQAHNGTLSQLGVRSVVKTFEPEFPKENARGRPIAFCRRRNARKKWYYAAYRTLLPTLPEAELKTLEGLISGDVAWTRPTRRKAPENAPKSKETLNAAFLARGPQKGTTFREFVNGRPHNIDRRFMQRLWRRISSLVPRFEKDPISGRHRSKWDSIKVPPKLSVTVDENVVDDLFKGLSLSGKKLKPMSIKSEDSNGVSDVHQTSDVPQPRTSLDNSTP